MNERTCTIALLAHSYCYVATCSYRRATGGNSTHTSTLYGYRSSPLNKCDMAVTVAVTDEQEASSAILVFLWIKTLQLLSFLRVCGFFFCVFLFSCSLPLLLPSCGGFLRGWTFVSLVLIISSLIKSLGQPFSWRQFVCSHGSVENLFCLPLLLFFFPVVFGKYALPVIFFVSTLRFLNWSSGPRTLLKETYSAKGKPHLVSAAFFFSIPSLVLHFHLDAHPSASFSQTSEFPATRPQQC